MVIRTECERVEDYIELQIFYFQNENCFPFLSRKSLCVGLLLLACLVLLVWNRSCDGRILAICTREQDVIIVKTYKNVI